MFSKSCEYAIKACLFIATQSMGGKKVKIGPVAQQIQSPEAFTAKILSILTKKGIVKSQKGPTGGFEIEKSQINNINLSKIVKAIDGEKLFIGCALGLKECSHSEPCPIHFNYVNIRGEWVRMLDNTTLYDLAMSLKMGKSVLIGKTNLR